MGLDVSGNAEQTLRSAGWAVCAHRPSVVGRHPCAIRRFSLLAAPKKLSDVVKLDLLVNETSGRILQIWMEYHAKKEGCAAGILSRAEFDVVTFRSQKR